VDVDAVCDGKQVVIGGVMQHIEEAGVHSGDSSSVLPPYSLSPEVTLSIEEQTTTARLELGVLGLMNVQFAVKGSEIFVIEVNPRASRTVPFVSKANGPAAGEDRGSVMAGKSLPELGVADRAASGACRGEGVGVSVREVPRCRYAARAGDALDRRGDGDRADLRARFGKALRASGMTLPVKGGRSSP